MKPLLLTLLIAFVSFTCYAQINTTYDDFNYITNSSGLKQDLISSRGLKNGCSLEPVFNSESVTWADGRVKKANLFYYKIGSMKKALVVLIKDEKGNSEFVCIPGADSSDEIWNLSIREFESLGSEWKLIYTRILTKVISLKLL